MIISRKDSGYLLSAKGIKVIVQENKQIKIESSSETVIEWPGEYEVGGITVRVYGEESGLAFMLFFDDLRIFFPAYVPLQTAEVEIKDLGDIELLVAAPESGSWSPKEWKKFIEEIEPRIVVLGEVGEKADALRKELGMEMLEKIDKLEITSKNLPSDNIRFVHIIA